MDVKNFVVIKTEFYDDGFLLKTLLTSEIKKVGNYWMPMKMSMINNQSGSQTIIETTNIKLDVDIDDSKFTTNYLKKR